MSISRRKRRRHLLLDASLSADTAAVTPAQSCLLGTARAVDLLHICRTFGFAILKTVWTTVLCSLCSRRNPVFCCCDLRKFSRLPFQLLLSQSGDGEHKLQQYVWYFLHRSFKVFSRSVCSFPPYSSHIIHRRNYQGG